MIINVDNLKKAIKEADMSHDRLAEAIARPGLDAKAAINNWTRRNFKPKPTPKDLNNLANALKVPLKSIVQFDGAHRWARIAPRKARLLTDLIRGRDIDSAISLLRFSKKRSAVYVKKVLETAIAAAEESDADVTRLMVVESRADEGPTIKRFRPKDRGRAHQILKRTSHIMVTVEEV